jgi:3-hydroxyisobutyrate dehydrogenase
MTEPKPALGFIGLGNMGGAMTRRLVAAGHTVFAYDVVPGKVPQGALSCASAADVARQADIVLVCVTNAKALEAAVFGPSGVAEGASASKLLVDHTSSDPETARHFAQRLAPTGMRWLDAPISGGVGGAVDGSLVVFCGGDAADVARFRPIAPAIAQKVTHVGPIGTGQATKLCNQVLVGGTLALLAETVSLARRSGIDPAMLPEALRGGFADSRPLQVWGPRMAARHYEPKAGAVGGMLKDLDAVAKLARSVEAPVPMAARAAEVLRQYVLHAGAEKDTASVAELYD